MQCHGGEPQNEISTLNKQREKDRFKDTDWFHSNSKCVPQPLVSLAMTPGLQLPHIVWLEASATALKLLLIAAAYAAVTRSIRALSLSPL
jgi:hypothetical protein